MGTGDRLRSPIGARCHTACTEGGIRQCASEELRAMRNRSGG